MTKLEISTAEKPLLLHLKNGGNADDDKAHDCIANFVTAVSQDDEIKGIVDRHGSSSGDLYMIYRVMLDATMPSPCIEAGGPLLVPTLFFMEPIRLDALLADVSRLAAEKQNYERKMILIEASEICAKQVWKAHTQARGESRFLNERKGGCLGLIVFGVLLIGSGVAVAI